MLNSSVLTMSTVTMVKVLLNMPSDVIERHPLGTNDEWYLRAPVQLLVAWPLDPTSHVGVVKKSLPPLHDNEK